jgi:hypothetical protein
LSNIFLMSDELIYDKWLGLPVLAEGMVWV